MADICVGQVDFLHYLHQFSVPSWLAVGATEELEQEEAGGTAQRVSQKHASSDGKLWYLEEFGSSHTGWN